MATPTATGKFEVQIVGGPLIWSKLKTGSFPTSDADFNQIFAQIDEFLKQ